MEEKCKSCERPLLSDREKARGICSRCFEATGKRESQNGSAKARPTPERAKTEIGSKDTPGIPKSDSGESAGILREFPASKGDLANIIPLSFKVSRALDKKLTWEIGRRKVSKSACIRSLIQQALIENEKAT